MREIYLHGNNHKEEQSDIDYLSASSFYKKLHEIEKQSKQGLIVHLHTIGGSWDDGMAVYDSILYSNCPITIIGHGSVYSIGTIIMQASKKRYLMPK
jgi:ATP-dependent protease ClpP protease subunit